MKRKMKTNYNYTLNISVPTQAIETQNPCVPSPCGPNAQCVVKGEVPSCSCHQNYIGTPPNCRPECISNSECPSNKAWVNKKCENPCLNACSPTSECHVISHVPRCTCPSGYSGNPLIQCTPYGE